MDNFAEFKQHCPPPWISNPAALRYFHSHSSHIHHNMHTSIHVLDPGKGVCTDPGGRDATVGGGGPGPPVGAGELQSNLDRGGVKTKQNG